MHRINATHSERENLSSATFVTMTAVETVWKRLVRRVQKRSHEIFQDRTTEEKKQNKTGPVGGALTGCIGVGRHVSAGGGGGQRQMDGVLAAGTNVCCAGAADPAITSSGACGFHGGVRARTAARRRRADDDDACPVPRHPYRSRGRVSLRGHGPARRRPNDTTRTLYGHQGGPDGDAARGRGGEHDDDDDGGANVPGENDVGGRRSCCVARGFTTVVPRQLSRSRWCASQW